MARSGKEASISGGWHVPPRFPIPLAEPENAHSDRKVESNGEMIGYFTSSTAHHTSLCPGKVIGSVIKGIELIRRMLDATANFVSRDANSTTRGGG